MYKLSRQIIPRHLRLSLSQKRFLSEAPDQENDNDVRTRVLLASLKFVPQHGWTTTSLAEGAKSVGLPSTAHGLFPKGGIDLIHGFYAHCNQDLVNHLKTEKEIVQKNMTSFIRDAVEYRLRLNSPFIGNWPNAMAKMALPQNAPESLKLLAQLCDDIWYEAGDKSTDINWYTKRGLLAAVYKSSEFYMIQDTSEDFNATWKFLDRRLKDLSTVGKFIRDTGNMGEQSVDNFFALFEVFKNTIGFNSKRR
ncbi:DgyrCDS9456 [Dimorphilus gyrociliatus]|uniref:Ubiquinone biosynthesis protein n=1 Tax=Dimorphilus gyrociliatus TaxID=2664684 RepID=A0A7I8VXE1_9ANNE|nr:DgyrCDS9456 [Dimorphilus gyrociliatus]